MLYALADTGIWYAMFDRRDQNALHAPAKEELLELCQVILPWPTLFETLRTRMARNKLALEGFQRYLKRHNVNYLDDAP